MLGPDGFPELLEGTGGEVMRAFGYIDGESADKTTGEADEPREPDEQ